jgi:hypothetical protein
MTTPTARLTAFLTSIVYEFASHTSNDYHPMQLLCTRDDVEELQQALEGWIPEMFGHQLAAILDEIDALVSADEEAA